MKLSLASLALLAASASAFTAVTPAGRASTSLNILAGTQSATERVANVMAARPEENEAIDALVKKNFPGAISNKAMETKIASILEAKGFTPANTLLCTSLCCDELARNLEDDLNKVYGHNFNLGGLSGFPFAGNTGFGAMSAHVPDDGFCLTIHGPHVGITKEGQIGKVERSGIALVDTCCGSAVAASNYLKGITDGSANINPRIQQFTDFQQGAVQELILPFGKRLARADERMRELPYALYDSQEVMVTDIVNSGKASIKQGLAVLGGIQINTAPDQLDYFHPLRFDYYDADGNLVENMLPYLR
uniref:Limiting CO2-inducible protein B/C beta carbonyic anhydrase domain-containing protein n=1 Tax=Skeletonema marinoi TaxID=267567 RepID=A0A7S0TI02_9STRA